MSNNQVDRLEVGTVYEWHGRRLTFTQVLGPTRNGGWYALDGAGQPWSFARTDMPTLAAPEPTTPAPTFAWRQVGVGDYFFESERGILRAAGGEVIGQWRWVVVFP